ncbi:MAG: hypothetical protein V4649_17340 [Bacteroidota bacterium]
MPVAPNKSIIYILVLVCIISRIPQLVSDNLLLDGDECVVAIMAKHMLQGKAITPYFYGQSYGFSLIECLLIVPFYLLLGFSTVAVKLAMLALWTTGVILLYKALELFNKGNSKLPILLILVFIWSPAWAVWSMKARGGYLTSFATTSALLFLLFNPKKTPSSYLLIGLLCCLIFESQPLWIPGLLPLLAGHFLIEKKISNLIRFLAPIVVIFTGLHFYKQSLPSFGQIPFFMPTGAELSSAITRLPNFLYYSLHGNYFFNEIQQPNFFCAFIAVVWSLVVVLILLIAAYNIIRRKAGTAIFNYSALSLLLCLGYTIFSVYYQPRYLLPLSGYTLLSLILLFNLRPVRMGILAPAFVTTMVAGIVSVITFYDFQFSTIREKKLTDALHKLSDQGIHYAFSNDNLFTWQVLFYSNEDILCRERLIPGRYPAYQRKIDSAYSHGAKTAYIAYPLYPPAFEFKTYFFINEYLVAPDPPARIILPNFPASPIRP